MIQANLLEQIAIFWNILINNSYLWILGLVTLGLIFLLALANKFHNKKITKILYAIAYLGVFGTLIGFFHTEILELFDYLVNNIFLFLFFPNLAIYALVLVIVNFIIIKSTFSNKDSKIIKIFNIGFFILFNIIFYLIIDNVVKNNINVYEQLSIYTNNNLLVLVELSMKLFIVWLLLLGIIKISSSLVSSIELAKSTNKNLTLVENNNQSELDNVNTLSKVIEINPDLSSINEIPEIHNKFNDYLDIVPMKKQMKKLTDNFRAIKVPEIEQTQNTKIEQLEEDETIVFEPKKDTTLTEAITKVNPFDALTFDNKDVLVLSKEDKKEAVQKPIITLSSYDSIFKDENLELENKVNNNMEIVFDNTGNYLQNILTDIEDLKNDCNDEEKIKKVYNTIQMNQNELTLSDYNYLINELIAIKK